MTRVHIFCEGQTEESFVREILGPYFSPIDIWLNPIIVRTGPQGKGGVSSYGKIKHQIEIKCKEDQGAWVTTLLDFYGLPSDFPGIHTTGNSITRARAVEGAFQSDIKYSNFLAHIVVHEFETLLFSDTTAFSEWFDDVDVTRNLAKIRESFKTPEHIDEGKDSAPSKRILAICQNYDKVLHGSLIVMSIGLDKTREECPIFDCWIKKLESKA